MSIWSLNDQCQQFQINYRCIYVSLSSSTYLRFFSWPISYATLWARFKCYQITSQPVYQAMCILEFCQLYPVILFQYWNRLIRKHISCRLTCNSVTFDLCLANAIEYSCIGNDFWNWLITLSSTKMVFDISSIAQYALILLLLAPFILKSSNNAWKQILVRFTLLQICVQHDVIFSMGMAPLAPVGWVAVLLACVVVAGPLCDDDVGGDALPSGGFFCWCYKYE